MIWRIKRIIQLLLFLYRNFEKIKEVVIDSSLLKNEIQILNQEKREEKKLEQEQQQEKVNSPNLIVGDGVSIHPSSILITAGTGKIVLSDQVYIGRHVEIGTEGEIKIGRNSSIQDRNILLGDVEIGSFCTFAANIYISSGNHQYKMYPNRYIKLQDEIVSKNLELIKKHSKKVTIEDDCWIGYGVIILQGVKVGKGSIIGANSVVNKDIPPYSIVAGAPARIIKKRIDFSPKKHICANLEDDLPYFYSGIRVEEFQENNQYYSIENLFKLSLGSLESKASTIHLKINNLSEFSFLLLYNEEGQSISPHSLQVYTFNILNDCDFYEFEIRSKFRLSNELKIEEVWLQ